MSCKRCGDTNGDLRTLTVGCGVEANVYRDLGLKGEPGDNETFKITICKACRGSFLQNMASWFYYGGEG